jgi:hypothetical protein
MPLKKDEEEKVIERLATNIIEGCKKGGHKCINCGQVSIPLIAMAEEFKPRVKDLVVRELGHKVKVGLCVDGYCEDCRWDKLGIGLEVKVVVKVAREGEESPDQIVQRLKSRFKSLELPFKITGVERMHRTEEGGWQ